MSNFKNLFGIFFLGLALTILNGCAGFNQTDARKFPPNPELRVKKNIEEGRGFRIMGGNTKGGVFEFASSNYLWRATLDTIDFMPLVSANYSGGIIITDWYVNKKIKDKRIKITAHIRTSELRSDGIKVKVHVQKLIDNIWSDTVTDNNLASKIENNILNEARNLRVNANK